MNIKVEKVAIYASFKNKRRSSMDFFLKQITDWCLLKNYDYTIYFDKVDNRLDLNRKELNILKNDIQNGKYRKVVMKNIMQLSRNIIHNIEFFQFLEKNNCNIECIDEFNLDLYKNICDISKKQKEEKGYE